RRRWEGSTCPSLPVSASEISRRPSASRWEGCPPSPPHLLLAGAWPRDPQERTPLVGTPGNFTGTEGRHEGDVLVMTAGHGCNPTSPSTDHSREYVPLLVYGSAIRPGAFLGTRHTFADLGRTVADLLGVPAEDPAGDSLKSRVVADARQEAFLSGTN
ncbi:MAG: hypothetical protein ACM3ZU_13280, partial [Bacteroidota bacterium]